MIRVARHEITFLGSDLCRPECVVGELDGTLWVSDARGGITRLSCDGTAARLGRVPGTPNGIAIDRDNRFLVTDIDNGVLYRIDRTGDTVVVMDRFEGRPLGSLNFVYVDARGRTWLTISTRTVPRMTAVNEPVADGYILLIEDGKPRMVANHLYFPNEVRIDTGYQHLYLAETTAGRILRFRLLDSGGLGPPKVFGPNSLFAGAWVDGLAFDKSGALWVTEVTRNGIHRIEPNGSFSTVFEDPQGQILRFPSSLAFIGDQLTQVVIGSTQMTQLATFMSPVPGCPMDHWR